MNITIQWENRNSGATSVNVYRSPSTIDSSNLPTTHAILPGDAISFTDDNVERGKKYYYRFELVKGNERSISENIEVVAKYYTGPGPQELVRGDMDCGYFGIVSSYDFIRYDTLVSLLGLPLTGLTEIPTHDWLKVAHNGKVLYVAKQPIMRGASCNWRTLYQSGLIYGTNDSGSRALNTLPEVNQLRVINVRNSDFKVRVLKAFPDPPPTNRTNISSDIIAGIADATTNRTNSSFSDLNGSEWADIIVKFLSANPRNVKGGKFEILDSEVAFNGVSGVTINYAFGMYEVFQELSSASAHHVMGAQPSGYEYPTFIGTMGTTSSSSMWRPVLELID